VRSRGSQLQGWICKPRASTTGFQLRARLWGIAIADTRVLGYQAAQVQIAWTQLSCRANGKNFMLNDDLGPRGWMEDCIFGIPGSAATTTTNPCRAPMTKRNMPPVIRVGDRTDRIWHFWSPSPRAALPPGALEGCAAKARVKISPGALLQIGFDYWRNPTVGYGSGGNNHEAGVSNWYFPSWQWQEVTFTHVGGPQF
jgi:hypothetical protein